MFWGEFFFLWKLLWKCVSHNLLFNTSINCSYGNTCFHKTQSVNIALGLVHASWLKAHNMQSNQNGQLPAEEACIRQDSD